MMVEYRHPHTIEEAQQRGILVATVQSKDGIQYAVTERHYLPPSKMISEEHDYDDFVIYYMHKIISLGDDKVRHDDVLDPMGLIEFGLKEERWQGPKEAMIDYSELEPNYRGKGLGLLLYKTAINDLIENRYRVLSDYNRSPEAERVWQSLLRDNPERIRTEKVYGGASKHFVATGFVGRRVRVRSYRRRR